MLVPEDVADPGPTDNEVLVAVERVSVTFVETQIRAGHPPSPAMLPALPAILGNGVGGVVAAVGPGGDQALIGRRVVSSLHGTGGYAARAVADRAALVDVPEELGMATAVALLADGRTALLLAHNAALRSGETALVLAASGGVGSLLVRLAHQAGARVIGAAGSPRKLDQARELGADVVVQYSTPQSPAGVRIETAGVDVVFDGVGGSIGRAAFELLRRGGRFLPYGMSSGAFAAVSGKEAAAGVTIAVAAAHACTSCSAWRSMKLWPVGCGR